MKKHISWLLIVLLLTGCTKGAILQEKKEDAIDVNTQTQEGSSSMKPPMSSIVLVALANSLPSA